MMTCFDMWILVWILLHCVRNDNVLFPSLRADEIGTAIHKQKELESKIDSLVYTLYNLSDDEITTIDSKNLKV